MSPMLLPQTMTISQADFFGDALQPGRAHFARRSDRKPIAGDEERLAACTRARKSGIR